MSTELPNRHKLNVSPATAEEIRAKYNTEADTDGTYDNATYEQQLAKEEESTLTRGQQMRRILLIGSGALGVGVAAMGIANTIGNASAESHPTPSAEASAPASHSASPEATAPTTNGTLDLPSSSPSPSSIDVLTGPEARIEKLKVPAGLSPEALGETLTDRFSQLYMSGAEKATSKQLVDAGYTKRGDYVTYLAKQDTPIFAEALFGKNWKENPEVKQVIEGTEVLHASALEYRLLTATEASPFVKKEKALGTALISGDTSNGKAKIDVEIEENVAENPRLTKINATSDDGLKFSWQVSYHSENGSLVFDSATSYIQPK